MPKLRLRCLVLYYLLKAIRDLGVDLRLLLRRVAATAAKDVEYISREFYGGKMNMTHFEPMIRQLAEIFTREGLAESVDVSFGENVVTLRVKNCAYMDLAKEAIAKGEQSCPICLVSLAASIAMSHIKGYTFDICEQKTDPKAGLCELKVSYFKE